MAAHIEFNRRYPSDAADGREPAAPGRADVAFEAAGIAHTATRDILANAISYVLRERRRPCKRCSRSYGFDSERRPRELDPVLGIQAPAFVPTLRALTEQFPNSPVTQPAFLRLADAYEDLPAVRARRAGARRSCQELPGASRRSVVPRRRDLRAALEERRQSARSLHQRPRRLSKYATPNENWGVASPHLGI